MIRKLEFQDIKKCVSICESNFIVDGYSYDTKMEFQSQFENNNNQLEFYVFEEDGIIKGVGGLANCWFDDGVFGLCTCYVLPDHQGKGIGKKLTEYRINRIKELGGEIIFSTTKKTWHLERFGFKIIESPYEKWSLMQLIIKK